MFLAHATVQLCSLESQKSEDNTNPVCLALLSEEDNDTTSVNLLAEMQKVPKSLVFPPRT